MKTTWLLAMALAAGCSFNPGKGSDDLGGNMGDDMGDAGDVGDGGADMTMVCTPGNKSCSGMTLSTCNLDGTAIDTTTCTLGCNTAGTDCQALQPTAPAVAGDFIYAGLSELVIAASQTLLVFDTDTGEIRDGSGAVVRMANATPMSRNVESGIGFHRTSGVGIWTFSKLTVPATTTIVFKNPYAASILSAGDLTIAGTIDLRGYADPTKALMTGAASTLCMGTVAGPGGTIGGTQSTVAMGAGAGGGSTADLAAGGGGAGYGDVGGAGGKDGATNGGTAGVMTGTAAINPLAGGFGGGASTASGGGGGGALQLAAEGTITISGKINAGGCGGNPGTAAAQGGGGGGSGGAILVEAATVHVASTGILAANGGGGGAGGSANATQGDPGDASNASANGGSGGGAHNGGAGGSLGTTNGATGSNGNGAGGGGGAVGRVRLNARTTPTVDSGATVSPAQTAGTVVIQ